MSDYLLLVVFYIGLFVNLFDSFHVCFFCSFVFLSVCFILFVCHSVFSVCLSEYFFVCLSFCISIYVSFRIDFHLYVCNLLCILTLCKPVFMFILFSYTCIYWRSINFRSSDNDGDYKLHYKLTHANSFDTG